MAHTTYPKTVHLVEVGLRDGLQAEKEVVPTELKLELINDLLDAGLKHIQIASFVHPKVVPQMADAEAVVAGAPQRDGVCYSGLALNERGVKRAVDSGVHMVDCSISTSDTHSQHNARQSLTEARASVKAMIRTARAGGLEVRAGLQSVWHCKYEGMTPLTKVVDMAREILDQDVAMLALSDTTGMANPRTIAEVVHAVAQEAGDIPLIMHLHDTYGMGMANVTAALQAGVSWFDASFGSMGGCPFVPNATGNIATEDSLHLLHGLGCQTGIDMNAVAACSWKMERFLNKELPGRLQKIIHRDGAE